MSCFLLGGLQPSNIEAFTCACEDVMRIHYCVSRLVSENVFLLLQKAQVWTGASCPSKEKCRECLYRFNLGRNCDSKRLHSSKKTSSVVPFTLTVVGYIFFDCLVDAERSSVIESESKGTGAE